VLTRQDLDMIYTAVTRQLHGKPSGTIASWSNPDSQNSGSIKPVKKLDKRNQKCEELEYTIRSVIHTECHRFTSCLGSDGTWKLREAKGSDHRCHSRRRLDVMQPKEHFSRIAFG
jgi:surface antigen